MKRIIFLSLYISAGGVLGCSTTDGSVDPPAGGSDDAGAWDTQSDEETKDSPTSLAPDSLRAKFAYNYIYYREGDERYENGFMGSGRKYHEKYETHEDYMAAFPEGMNTGDITTTAPFFEAAFGKTGVVPTDDAYSFKTYATFIDTDTVDHANALSGFERHVDVWQFLLDDDGNVMRNNAVLLEISTYAEYGRKHRKVGVQRNRKFNGIRLFIVDLDDSDAVDADAIECVHAAAIPGQHLGFKKLVNITDDVTGRIIGKDDGSILELGHPSTIEGWSLDLPLCDKAEKD